MHTHLCIQMTDSHQTHSDAYVDEMPSKLCQGRGAPPNPDLRTRYSVPGTCPPAYLKPAAAAPPPSFSRSVSFSLTPLVLSGPISSEKSFN